MTLALIPSSSSEALLAIIGLMVIVTLLAAIVLRNRAAASRKVLRSLEARFSASKASLTSTTSRLEAVLHSIEGGVLVLDPEQRVLNLNRAAEEMLALVERHARGRLLQEVFRQPELHRCAAAALAGDNEETEIAILGDVPRRIRVVPHLLPGTLGQPAGLILILTDLTRLRRLEAVRTDFASNVSHELRTPITNIKGYVETLLDPAVASDPVQSEQFLRVIARNADRLIAIVEDMLMLAQLERPESKETLAVEHARIAPIIESAIAAHAPEANARQITIQHDTPGDLGALVNPPLLEQAVSNLVVNAVRYSPAGTNVRIHSKFDPRALPHPSILIEVIDQGPGIGDEHLTRIFERFYRVDRDRGRERGGTGLGLAIVKHIMNLHRGRVEVESEPGRGSRFRLVLPAS